MDFRDVCNTGVAQPLDGQECGKAGRYEFTYKFTSENPLDFSMAGVKIGGPAAVKDGLGNVLGECNFSATLE